MCSDFLDKVYKDEYKDPKELYREWAGTYDNELAQNEYITPIRTAKALATFASNKSTPILDFGCGTGLSAEALLSCGFSSIDGVDISSEMIEIARGKSIYRNLQCFNPDKGIPVKQNEYSVITAIGVISVGAAPISIFDQVLNLLPQNGLFAFSFNEHSLVVPEYSLKVEQTVKEKKAEQLFCELGPHILKRDLKSKVYVIKKL
ncbi:methyltransferase domain-containing protein [Paracoccaceae bacterium]|nr:methyltransferase domain-containing protein [Paracoccaceae bacterium]